jgi:chromosome segregation ATPase
LKENLQKINDENTNNKSDLNKIKEDIDKKISEYEEKIKRNQEEKSLKMVEIEERIKLIEENNFNNIQNLQKGNVSNMQELNNIKNLIKNNNILINDEISLIKKDMTFVKNEIQNLKGAKVNMNSDLNKIMKEIEYINQKFEKSLNDINNIRIEIQTKINNYEATNRLFQQNFSDIKEDLLNHLDEMNNVNKDDIIKIREETFGQIKQIKNDMNQFNLNIIKENQKFIDYSQNQLQEHDDNLKKLFEYTSDDIEVLKKKSDTLESLLKNTRNEMINNINSVEGFLTNRYDSIFKSITSDRNINKF